LRVAHVALVVSSVSSRAVRQARYSQNAWARHVERVESCRDVTSQVEFGLYSSLRHNSTSGRFHLCTYSLHWFYPYRSFKHSKW